jgi:hypothetical protein
LATSKTDQFGKGVSIHISAQANKTLCPVFNLKKFLNSRPLFGGPLFCHFDGNPLTRYQFAAILHIHINKIEKTKQLNQKGILIYLK